MSQGDLPAIHGSEWRAKAPLTFTQPLLADAARTEVLRFVAQRHDGHLFLVANVWDVLAENEPAQFEGESWHTFTTRFIEAVHRGLQAQIKAKMGQDEGVEVIPRRTMDAFLDRRAQHFLVDLRLTFRRLAHYMAVGIGQRLEWQRMMTRTRKLDAHLKTIYTDGMATPDGGMFGGKGFRSTWQEGVVAVATALQRQPDAPRDALPGKGYDGDLIAPMIRAVSYTHLTLPTKA